MAFDEIFQPLAFPNLTAKSDPIHGFACDRMTAGWIAADSGADLLPCKRPSTTCAIDALHRQAQNRTGERQRSA